MYLDQPMYSQPTPPQKNIPVVYIVDDDESVRISLALLVRSVGWHAETFRTSNDFLSQPAARVPNCLVLDVDHLDWSGLDLQKKVAIERADMPLIFVAGHGDVPMTVRAMKAGAIDVLTKPTGDDVLLGAIAQALERSSAALARDFQIQELRARHETLSRREREVMALVVAGLMNKQIAFELGISEITVKAHRGSAMRKMKARSLAELVTFAARLGTTH